MNIQQLAEVNLAVNSSTNYCSDKQQYQTSEYWAVAMGLGDCEDYSLAKLHKLLELGWPIEKLRIATCKVLGTQQLHAVLLAELHNSLFILDNRSSDVVEPNTFSDYVWIACQEVGGSLQWIPCKKLFERFNYIGE